MARAVAVRRNAEGRYRLGRLAVAFPRSLPIERDTIRVAHKTGWDTEKLPDASGFRGAVRNDAGYVETPAEI